VYVSIYSLTLKYAFVRYNNNNKNTKDNDVDVVVVVVVPIMQHHRKIEEKSINN
jgi:hypothetical protein